MEYKLNGSTRWQGPSSEIHPPGASPFSWANGWGGSPFDNSIQLYVIGNHEWYNGVEYFADVLHDGTVSTIFRWTVSGFDNTTTLPPSRLYVRLTTTAEAGGDMGSTLIVDNGAGSPIREWVEYNEFGLPILKYKSQTGHSYVTLNVNGNEAETPPLPLKAGGWSPHPRGGASGTLDYRAEILPSFYIREANEMGIDDPNYRKLPGDATIQNPLRELNIRDRDLAYEIDLPVHWDTVVGQWVGQIILEAPYPFWNDPLHSWTHSGDGSQTTFSQMDFERDTSEVGYELLFGSDTKSLALGKQSTAMAYVTDEDDPGAPTIPNKFTIRWHKPYENWKSHGTTKHIYETAPNFRVDSPGFAHYPGGIQCHWREGSSYWAVADEAEKVLGTLGTIAGPFNPVFEPLFTLAGVAAGAAAPEEKSGSAPWAWGIEGSTYSPSRDDSQQNLYIMRPELQLGYILSFWKGEEYGDNGYEGPAYRAIQKRNGHDARWVGHFERDTYNEGGDGPPSDGEPPPSDGGGSPPRGGGGSLPPRSGSS